MVQKAKNPIHQKSRNNGRHASLEIEFVVTCNLSTRRIGQRWGATRAPRWMTVRMGRARKLALSVPVKNVLKEDLALT